MLVARQEITGADRQWAAQYEPGDVVRYTRGVWALAQGHGNLYVGGDFTGVHGRAQQRFAILPRR